MINENVKCVAILKLRFENMRHNCEHVRVRVRVRVRERKRVRVRVRECVRVCMLFHQLLGTRLQNVELTNVNSKCWKTQSASAHKL